MAFSAWPSWHGNGPRSAQLEYIKMIRHSAESLLTVLNDILDFSKVEAGKLQLDRAPFGLRTLLDEMMRTFMIRAGKKGLALSVRVHADTPDTLLGDSNRLRQVLINLVGNAIKFTHIGEVVISVGLAVERGATKEEVCLEFAVLDTGIGIPEDRREQIFEPFEQADRSTTRLYRGTGLGLAITHKLVSLMGGSISVERRSEGGSVFRFTRVSVARVAWRRSTRWGQLISTASSWI